MFAGFICLCLGGVVSEIIQSMLPVSADPSVISDVTIRFSEEMQSDLNFFDSTKHSSGAMFL